MRHARADVEGFVPVGHCLLIVVVDDSLASQRRELPTSGRVAEEPDERVRQHADIIGGDEIATASSIEQRGVPPTAVATTGTPAAMASSTLMEVPSAFDGSTKMSNDRRSPGTSRCSPIM